MDRIIRPFMQTWRPYGNLPEMRAVPEEERDVVWHEFRKTYNTWRESLLSFALFLLILLPASGGVYQLGERFHLPPWTRLMILLPFTCAATYCFGEVFVRLLRSPLN